MDGGIGEAALMGALVGGGASLLTGKNPLTGALMGGLTGGAMSGISGALAGAGDKVVSDQIINNAIENSGVQSGVVDSGLLSSGLNPGMAYTSSGALSPGMESALTSGVGNATASEVANAGLTGLGGMQNVGLTQGVGSAAQQAVQEAAQAPLVSQGVASNAGSAGIRDLANSARNIDGSAVTSAAKEAAAAPSKGVWGDVKDWYKTAPWYEKAGAGIAGSLAINQLFSPPDMLDPNIGQKEYAGPGLHDLSPDFRAGAATPDVYKSGYTGYVRGPGYADGGIAGLDSQSPMVMGMGQNTGYPQGMQDHTQYATPSQMPVSSSVVNADYEQKTNPYTGEPVQMARGGVARFATGGNTPAGGQVYYDPAKGQYYTQSDVGGYGGIFTSPNSPFGGLFQTMPGYDAMTSDPGSPFYDGRTYLGSSLGGQDTSFQASQPIANVYTPQYSNAAPVVSASTAPAAKPAPSYSLADSLGLLQATNPGIAAMYTNSAPAQTAASVMSPDQLAAYQQNLLSSGQAVPQSVSNSLQGTPYPGHAADVTDAQRAAWNATNAPGLTPGSKEWTAKTGIPEYAQGGIAGIQQYSLGGYAAGGNPRLLKGPGDGMSDNIPATIGGKQPARLADGEFVVPADVVSHLGNGSTDAGAKHLYDMMNKVRKARTGKVAQGKQIKPQKFLPA